MKVTTLTLFISVVHLLAAVLETIKTVTGRSVLLFEDQPITILVLYIAGILFLIGFFKLKKYASGENFIYLAVALSITTFALLGFYNTYVGFGYSTEAFSILATVMLIQFIVAFWYLRKLNAYIRQNS